MGSIITLSVGLLEIDWGKNNMFRNHSVLFLPSDKSLAPYYYADDIVEEKKAFSRKLIDTKERLELLGYSLAHIRNRFEFLVQDAKRHSLNIDMSYDDFAKAMSSVEIANVKLIEEGDYDFGELGSTIIRDPEFNKVVDFSLYPKWDLGEFLENVDPYLLLRLLIENPANHDQLLVWRYQDVIDGGWTNLDEIYTPLSEHQKFLVVTEGSTDSSVLKASLGILKPDIADFFKFIDMEENYPFTGSGNLYRFCQGLCSIGIQNKMVIVFDNDTEGVEKYHLVKQLKLPDQMSIMRLPDLPEFNDFECIGPNGITRESINGRAVSIECFLDFSKVGYQPRVRWTSYNPRTCTYQGEIEHKQEYVKSFLRLKGDDTYDAYKLTVLLSSLYHTCIDTPGLSDDDVWM